MFIYEKNYPKKYIVRMNNFTCNICNQSFKTKQNLEKHQNKIFKCNFKTEHQCDICKKYFRNQSTLVKHENNNLCRNVNTTDIIVKKENKSKDNDAIQSAIKSIIESDINNESKTELLKKYNCELSNEELTKLFDMNINLDGKVSYIYSFIDTNRKSQNNINNGTINTNSNNTVTNNIQINNFGQEDLSYMDNDYFKNLIMNQHIEKGYVQLIKDIYLNKDHPENKTVKVENINNKYAHIFTNGKWDAILKADLKEQLHKKNYTILKMHYDKLKKTMTIPKKEETYNFLKRDDFSDPHMMYVIDKIILLFYNGDELFDEDKINKNVV